jgi:hypothetical protein
MTAIIKGNAPSSPWYFGVFTDDGSTDPRPSHCASCGVQFQVGDRLSLLVTDMKEVPPKRTMTVQLAHVECPEVSP